MESFYLAFPLALGFLFSCIGTILIFKNQSQGLTGFGTFDGPWVDKKILSRARLGLKLLTLGIFMQGAVGIAALVI